MKVDLAYPRPPKFWHPLTGHICLQVWAIHRGSAGSSRGLLLSGPGVEEGCWWGFLFALKVHGVFLGFFFIAKVASGLGPKIVKGCLLFGGVSGEVLFLFLKVLVLLGIVLAGQNIFEALPGIVLLSAILVFIKNSFDGSGTGGSHAGILGAANLHEPGMRNVLFFV